MLDSMEPHGYRLVVQRFYRLHQQLYGYRGGCLHQRLRKFGYGVTKVTGWYPEENREMARENSFLTVNLNDEESFRDNLSELSEFYDQECFLYKKSGYDTPAVYVYTKDVDEYQKGDVKLLGRLRIGNMDADAYSQIKAGRITFE